MNIVNKIAMTEIKLFKKHFFSFLIYDIFLTIVKKKIKRKKITFENMLNHNWRVEVRVLAHTIIQHEITHYVGWPNEIVKFICTYVNKFDQTSLI